MEIKFYLAWVIKLKYYIEIDVYSSQTTVNKILNEPFYPFQPKAINTDLRTGKPVNTAPDWTGHVTSSATVRESRSETRIVCKQGNNMLLLTNCEVHKGKYLDRSFEVRTERSKVRTKN